VSGRGRPRVCALHCGAGGRSRPCCCAVSCGVSLSLGSGFQGRVLLMMLCVLMMRLGVVWGKQCEGRALEWF
jgi:hypothetical protein